MPELLILVAGVATVVAWLLGAWRHQRIQSRTDRAVAYRRWHEDVDIAMADRARERSTRNGRRAA